MIAYPTVIVNCFHGNTTSSPYRVSLKRAGWVCFSCVDKGLREIAIAGHQLPFCDVCDEWVHSSLNEASSVVFPFALCYGHFTKNYALTRDDYLQLVGWI